MSRFPYGYVNPNVQVLLETCNPQIDGDWTTLKTTKTSQRSQKRGFQKWPRFTYRYAIELSNFRGGATNKKTICKNMQRFHSDIAVSIAVRLCSSIF
jgi:hypothetical protein